MFNIYILATIFIKRSKIINYFIYKKIQDIYSYSSSLVIYISFIFGYIKRCSSLPYFSHYVSYSCHKTMAYYIICNIPPFNSDIYPLNHYFSFGGLIWKAPKTYNDITFGKEQETIICTCWYISSVLL